MTEIKCPRCGTSIKEEWSFCPMCGKSRGTFGWKLYEKVFDDGRIEYMYGPDWKAAELMAEGGYKTPEEAKYAWLEEWSGVK
jgi:hypothetical protein